MTAWPRTNPRRWCTTESIYLINTDNIMQALDARTGDLIWENHMRPPKSQAGGTGAMRNIAIYGDKIFAETTDAHLFALDARTGKTVWDVIVGDSAKGYGSSSGPIVIHGKVIQGENGCDRYKSQEKDQGCFISAFDPATGKLLWRFNTLARAGEPGGDTWGDLPNMLRVGAETWITGSFDPELNMTYWGVAQPKPWMQVSRGTRGTALYSSSTLALKPDDGKLAWYFQHVQGETLDMDEVYERVLVDIGDRKTLFTIGKAGILWKLDRKTGEFISAKETIFQNIFNVDQKTGKLSYRPDILEQEIGKWTPVCPSTEGGHNWQAMSYDPATERLIIPLSQSCMEMCRPQSGVHRRLGRHDGRPPVLRNARHGRQRRQARRIRREDHEGSVERAAAAVVSHRRAVDRRRHRVRRRSQPRVPRSGREHRQDFVADSPRHFRARFSGNVQRRRQAIRRRHHRPGRRQPAQRATHDSARHPLPDHW